ncbi:MAG: S9 family peptidase, partial [Brevundimonas sp.]
YSPGANYRSTPFSVDLDTGVGTPIDNFESFSDANGQPVARGQWDTDNGRYWVQAKDTVGWREIWSGDDYRIETPSVLGYGRTKNTVLLSVPAATGDQLFEVPLAGGTPRRLGFGEMQEPSPIYHRLTRELIGFSSLTENAYDVVFLDPTLAQRWASVTAAYPNKTVQVVSATPDFDKIIVLTQGAGDPGSYALIDMAAGRATPLGSQYPAVPTAAMGEVRYIEYRAADGMRIPAYLTLPPGREAKNLPLIMLPHGGPGARDEPGFDHWSQLLASRGYAVIQPQFRGSTGYGNAHLEAGYGEWGKKMQSDLTDGVHYLRDQGIIDPARVCIFGWSYGGYAAMAGATLDPETYRCAIAGAGVSDLPRMLAWERDQTGGKDSIVMRFWKRFMGADRINDNAIAQVSPARLADRVRGPVLLIHGRDDSVVPYEQSELFQRALQRSGKDVEMVELQGEDHWLSRASGRLRVSQALIDFLNRHNPAD